MGLGSEKFVSLKKAREEADKWRKVARLGKDPITERVRQRREAKQNLRLLADVAWDAFETRKAELKGNGDVGRWSSPLETHVLPKHGKTPVSEIDQIANREVIRPIWHTKAGTAQKAIERPGNCLKHAVALWNLQSICRPLPKRKRYWEAKGTKLNTYLLYSGQKYRSSTQA